MGHNATVVVMLDSMDHIEKDDNFGKKLANAIRKTSCYNKPVDVSAGSFANAATVIETHHADGYRCVLIGGNYGKATDVFINYRKDEMELELLKELARKLGYQVSRKPTKK